ncbi:MAG: hypothetical protein ACJ780_00155, partial [Solirubrobacteraceae bacterium]
MLEVRVARGCPGGLDPASASATEVRTTARAHSPRRLLRFPLLLILLCSALAMPALASGNALGGRAMWIWEMPQTDGGSLSAIVAAAHRFGLST